MTSSANTGYRATVYTKPGCGKCTATKIKIDRMGVPVDLQQIAEHPDKMQLMRDEGWSALPLVEVTTPGGETLRWNDLDIHHLDALNYLVNA